jgi:hypothetical protein
MALPNNDINVGAPPLLWSNVKDALDQINENFDSVAATMMAGGLTPVNFDTLNSNVSPAYDNTYSLGTLGTNRWKSVFLAEYQDNPGDQANGVYIGSAQIRGVASAIELPANSTIVGVPIKEPFFNSIQVDNDLRVEANTVAAPWGETVNLNSGTAMQLVVSSGADSITFNNTGVTRLNGTANQIGVSAATGNITLTNLGVLSLTSTTALPSGRTVGAGINIDNSTGSGIKITNTGVLSIAAGSAAINVDTDVATGIVTITNNAPAGNTFGSIIVDGDSSYPISANSPGANFKVNAGEGIALAKDVITDTITIRVNPVFDLRGSVFGDDSTVMVNAIDRVITAAGGFIGNIAGNVTGNVVGNVTGNVVGNTTGYHTGEHKGSVFGDDSTVIIDGNSGVVFGDIENTTVTTQFLIVGQIDPDPISGEIYLNGTVYGDLQGVVYGSTVGQLEGDVLDVNGDLLLDGTSRFLDGDVKGSVFGDDSSKIIDGVENRVYTNSLSVTEFIKFPTYANATARDAAITAPAQGMVILIIDNGSAATKLQAYISSSWIDL